jgi:hypothetical protein
LREDEDSTPVDQPVSGHDPVAQPSLPIHAEVVAPMDDESPGFDEAARVEEPIDALARRQLSRVVLFANAVLAAEAESASVHLGEARGGRGHGLRITRLRMAHRERAK